MKKQSTTKMTLLDQELLKELEYQIWMLGTKIKQTSTEIKTLADKQRARRRFYHNLILLKNKLMKGELME